MTSPNLGFIYCDNSCSIYSCDKGYIWLSFAFTDFEIFRLAMAKGLTSTRQKRGTPKVGSVLPLLPSRRALSQMPKDDTHRRPPLPLLAYIRFLALFTIIWLWGSLFFFLKAAQGAVPGQKSSYSGYSELRQAESSSSKVPCKFDRPFRQRGEHRMISSLPLAQRLCSQGSKNAAEPSWENECLGCVCVHVDMWMCVCTAHLCSPPAPSPPPSPLTNSQSRAGTVMEPRNRIEHKRHL